MLSPLAMGHDAPEGEALLVLDLVSRQGIHRTDPLSGEEVRATWNRYVRRRILDRWLGPPWELLLELALAAAAGVSHELLRLEVRGPGWKAGTGLRIYSLEGGDRDVEEERRRLELWLSSGLP